MEIEQGKFLPSYFWVVFNIASDLSGILQLSPEEEERRHVRRERNKQAAAKCRQKRVDLTNQLLSVRDLFYMTSV